MYWLEKLEIKALFDLALWFYGTLYEALSQTQSILSCLIDHRWGKFRGLSERGKFLGKKYWCVAIITEYFCSGPTWWLLDCIPPRKDAETIKDIDWKLLSSILKSMCTLLEFKLSGRHFEQKATVILYGKGRCQYSSTELRRCPNFIASNLDRPSNCMPEAVCDIVYYEHVKLPCGWEVRESSLASSD